MTVDDSVDDGVIGLQTATNRSALENLDGYPGDLTVDPAADDDVASRRQTARNGKSGLKNRTPIRHLQPAASRRMGRSCSRFLDRHG